MHGYALPDTVLGTCQNIRSTVVKKIAFIFALVLATRLGIAAPGLATFPVADFKPLPQHVKATLITAEALKRLHYKPTALDDALSAAMFDGYLKALDGEKLLFVQSDIDQWAGIRTQLDDAIMVGNLEIPFAIFNRYLQRTSERMAFARSVIKTGFDFQLKESLELSREKASWATSDAEINDLWRKRVKNEWLRLKLAGKDDKSIADTLDRRYENSLKRIGRTTADDAFQAFMNAYTMAIEPHTNYLDRRAAEGFAIAMRLSLVGIGAMLSEKDDHTLIIDLVPGGPAMVSGQLQVGDRIVGVAQGETGPMKDVVGWRTDDVVALIRGTSDSVVRLDILPAEAGQSALHKQVSLVRKQISLEEQAAKKSIVVVKAGGQNRRIGVIALPAFYQDSTARAQGKPDFKSATRDVAVLLNELKAEQVDGVLIDLRNNGGGSMNEAVELTGLFIDQGPVVQSRDAKGRVIVASDLNAGVAWDAPLAVLINRRSASSSEIFAAAIQDYGRGLIIGEQSFGKGTVQTMFNLDRVNNDPLQKLGDLKLTIAQFFRVDGGTTQLRGVQPDIAMGVGSDERFGEARYDNALPWNQIPVAQYTPVASLKPLGSPLLARHQLRVKKDPDYQDLQEDIAEVNALRAKNQISLNAAERRKEREAKLAKQKAREARLAASGKAADQSTQQMRTDDGLHADERNPVTERAQAKARKNDKDIVLTEAANIFSDAIDLQAADGQFVGAAARR